MTLFGKLSKPEPSDKNPEAEQPLDGGSSFDPRQAPPPQAPPSNFVEVARTEDAVILRPVGLGNMKVAMGLIDFTDEMLRKGYSRFVYDLSSCKGLDSTFMGSMVGLSSACEEMGGKVSLVNASENNLELLQIVGADKFMKKIGDINMEELETEKLDVSSPSPERRLELVKTAHEHLVDIDKRNAARFGAFLRQLSSELDKI